MKKYLVYLSVPLAYLCAHPQEYGDHVFLQCLDQTFPSCQDSNSDTVYQQFSCMDSVSAVCYGETYDRLQTLAETCEQENQ